jgi:serine-type D-Ala-D-Ala carboxypeptidase/endopeptidase
VVGVEGHGLWHRGDLPAGAATIFEIGSITKLFTALLLADMALEGVVELDEPVPGLPRRGRAVTLADLSSHVSGMPALPRGMVRRAIFERSNPWGSFEAADLEAAVPRTRLRREPGRRFRYSNYGVGLLGHVLAKRAGTTWEELVRERITRPLGMGDTGVDVPADRFATGHDRRGRPVPHWDLPGVPGAGALRSTAADLLTFLRLQSSSSDDRLARAARLTQEPRHRHMRIQVGLGWLIAPPKRGMRHPILLHGGGTGGFRSIAALVPQTGHAVVALSASRRDPAALAFRVLQTLARA